MIEKPCRQCGVTKTLDQFSVSKRGVRGPIYRTACKTCCATNARQWSRDNRERVVERLWKADLKRYYGLTVTDWQNLYDAQDGKCAICRSTEKSQTRRGAQFRLSVDHCHGTGRVRGLLCQRCNRAIGLLGDDVKLLNQAIQYLTGEGGSN